MTKCRESSYCNTIRIVFVLFVWKDPQLVNKNKQKKKTKTTLGKQIKEKQNKTHTKKRNKRKQRNAKTSKTRNLNWALTTASTFSKYSASSLRYVN